MDTRFTGLIVTIILKSPANARIQGRVSNVADQILTLEDAVFLASGLRMPEFRIHGSNVIDLDVSPDNFCPSSQAAQTAQKSPSVPGTNGHATLKRQENDPVPAPGKARQEDRLGHPASSHTKSLVDSAILSIRQKPCESSNGRITDPLHEGKAQNTSHDEPVKTTLQSLQRLPHGHEKLSGKLNHTLVAGRDLLEEGDASTSDAGTILLKQPNVASRSDKPGKPIGLTTRVDSIKVVFVDDERRELSQSTTELTAKAEATLDQDQDILPLKKESHRRKRRRRKRNSKAVTSEVEDKGITKEAGGYTVAFGQDKSSWNGTVGDKTRLTVSTSNHRCRARLHDENDGWATEDATDIQGMGEFDFQGNLSKFDKRTIFDQIRAQDSTAKESRLVSLNRLPAKPGTAGGKNLHHTENVLDSKDGGRWNSEAGETEEETSGERIGSGRSSRRTISRQSTKQLPSRKGSNIFGSTGQFISSSSTRVLSPLNRDPQSARTTSSIGKYSRVGSPMRSMTPSSAGSFRLVSSGRLCPVLRPIQQFDIERIAELELGLTEDMMTENAGRGIAEIALMALDLDGRRPAKEDHKIEPPFAVALAGNHQSGLRALSAARHLHNHGVRVIVCMLGLEREALLLENLRRQLQIFERSGGRVAHWDEIMTETERYQETPELVIDALLGTHLNFGDLRRDDQTVAYNLIDWVNHGKFEVLAVDIPTGIDASTGSLSYFEGDLMCMNAKFVASLVAPKAGLLEALSSGIGSNWGLYVVDLGISNTVWKTYGTRRRHGVEFGSGWVMELKYQRGSSD